MEVDETVDLELAAQFDFLSWLEQKGIEQTEAEEESVIVMKLELESKYSVPQMEKIDRLGQCSIIFSTTLVIVDFDLISERFM